jgi:NitT/TauT family transport system ATP-binding protein
MSTSVEFSQLQVRYGPTVIVDGLDLAIEEGEFTCFLGPSGCGKSTMLRMIGELAQPSGGTVTVLGERPAVSWDALGFVFQAPRLVPWRTALGNVILGLELRGGVSGRAAKRERALDAMRTVGIEHLADRRAHALSGGEQQRVAIARALALRPRILLMDEPFSALDVQTRRQLRKEMVALWQRLGITIVFVTHDVDEAIVMGSRIIVFSPKPTVILSDIAVDLPRPVDPNSPAFRTLHDGIVRLFGGNEDAQDELTSHA